MHAFLHCLSSQNYIAKSGAIKVNQRFWSLNQISVDIIWKASFHIYKTIHNINYNSGRSWNWLMHNNFKVRIVRLFVSNKTFILVTCTSGVYTIYFFHFCSDQGHDLCMAFPEWIRSSKKLVCRLKKRIVMPIKHHFGKSEWLKINLTKTMHSLCHIVFRKAYISYFLTSWSTWTVIAALSDCAPAHNNETMIISL